MAGDILQIGVSLDLNDAAFLAGIRSAEARASALGTAMGAAGAKGTVSLTGAGKAVNKVLLPALIKGHLISQTLAATFRTLTAVVRGFVSAVAPLPSMLDDTFSSFNARGFEQAASSFQEQVSKFRVVFGEFAGDATDFVNTFGRAVGRSKVQLTTAMATFQDTFVPLGFAREDAAKLSEGLTKLGVDLASFNEVADDEVFKRLTSGIVGNHNAVRRFGIQITKSGLKTVLALHGIDRAFQDLTSQEKSLARLAIIMKSSADANDDARRTANSFANTMRRVVAVVEDLKVELGQKLNKVIADTINKMGGIAKIKTVLKGIGSAIVAVSMELVKLAITGVTSFAKWIKVAGGAETVALRMRRAFLKVKVVIVTLKETASIMFGAIKYLWLQIESFVLNGVALIRASFLTMKSFILSTSGKIVKELGDLIRDMGRGVPDWFEDTKKTLMDAGKSLKRTARGIRNTAEESDAAAERIIQNAANTSAAIQKELDATVKGMGESTLAIVDAFQDTKDAVTILDAQILESQARFRTQEDALRRNADATEDLEGFYVDLNKVIEDLFLKLKKGKDATDELTQAEDSAGNAADDMANSMSNLAAQTAFAAEQARIATLQFGAFETARGRSFYVVPSNNPKPGEYGYNYGGENAFNYGGQSGFNLRGGRASARVSPITPYAPGTRSTLTTTIPGIRSFADGGLVREPVGQVERHEFVMPETQTRMFLPQLEQMRAAQLSTPPMSRSGGDVTNIRQSGSITQNISINVSGEQANPREIAGELARLARQGSRMGIM